MVAAACGGGLPGDKPWDKNKDGLVGQCEGLNQGACAATSGCRGEELACLAICQSDGNGGCLPCDAFQCVPTTPSLPPSCESRDVASCSADPRCELITNDSGLRVEAPTDCVAVCIDKGDGGCESACSTPPPAQQFCVTKQVSGCEVLPASLCSFVSACQLQTVTVCEGSFGPIDAGSPNAKPETQAPGVPQQDPPTGGCGTGGGCTSYQVCGPRYGKAPTPIPAPAPDCGAISSPSQANCSAVPGCMLSECAPCDAPAGFACPAVCAVACVPAHFGGGSNGSPPQK